MKPMNRVDSVGGDFPAPLSLGVMTGSNQTNVAHTGDIESFTPSIIRMTERSNLLQMTPCKRINDAPRVEPGVNLPGKGQRTFPGTQRGDKGTQQDVHPTKTRLQQKPDSFYSALPSMLSKL